MGETPCAHRCEHAWRCVGCDLHWNKHCECGDPGSRNEALCWRCNELTVEGLVARYPFGLPILSAALVSIVAIIIAYRPFNPLSVETLLSGGLVLVFLGFGGGFVAAFAAFIFLRWFHRLRIWWRPPL